VLLFAYFEAIGRSESRWKCCSGRPRLLLGVRDKVSFAFCSAA
jgi:hypothetical protein